MTTDMNAIVLGYFGRCDMLGAYMLPAVGLATAGAAHGAGALPKLPSSKNPPTGGGGKPVVMDAHVFDALFGNSTRRSK